MSGARYTIIVITIILLLVLFFFLLLLLRQVFIISNRNISNWASQILKEKYVAHLSVLSRISNCQGLGRKNKFEILKTDRIELSAGRAGRQTKIIGCRVRGQGLDEPAASANSSIWC